MNNKALFNMVVFILLIGVPAKCFAQANEAKKRDAGWHRLYSASEIEVKYKFSECNIPEWGTTEENAYLQFKNLSSKKVKFSWSPTLWYGDKCYNCDGDDPEMTYTITLEPGEILEGTCSTDCPRYLKIFGKYLNVKQEGTKRELKDFDLKVAKVELID